MCPAYSLYPSYSSCLKYLFIIDHKHHEEADVTLSEAGRRQREVFQWHVCDLFTKLITLTQKIKFMVGEVWCVSVENSFLK